jgi:integrase
MPTAESRADRERALLAVAYDTMARRSELVALDVEDLSFMEDGSGRVIIRRSKTDQGGGECGVLVTGYGGVPAGMVEGFAH